MNESELYTVTKQYHEKKDIDIWVVRLEVKVDDDTFAELKGFAKELHGYYSTFKDAKGFVFKSEKEANKFGKKLDDYLQIEETDEDNYELDLPEYADFEVETPKTVRGGKTEGSDEITETEELNLDNFCTALKLLIEDKGAKIITDTIYKTVEVLKSVDAFKRLPPSIEFILRIIIMKKYGQRLLDARKDYSQYQSIVKDFIYRTGFNSKLAEQVFECVLNAVGGITIQVNAVPETANNKTCTYKDKIKDFYSIGTIISKDQKLWCLWFNVATNAGNADFAVFRKRIEKCADHFVYTKVANGVGLYNQSDFNVFMKMVRDETYIHRM